MKEEIKPENLRIHSRADELIACLEGEIAKRDKELAACRVAVENCEVFRARIAELEARIVWLECEAQVNAAPVSEAKAQGVVMPEKIQQALDFSRNFADSKPDIGITERQHILGLANLLEKVARLNAAPVQQVSVPDGFCIGAWRDALEKIAKYAPQVNCAARTELERAGLIAVHALIAFSAPQFRHARGTQTASNAAPAAPAADAGHVFYGMDGNHP